MIAAKKQYSLFDFNTDYSGGTKPVNPITRILGLDKLPDKKITTDDKFFDLKHLNIMDSKRRNIKKRKEKEDDFFDIPDFIREFRMYQMLQNMRSILSGDSENQSKIKIEINI